jgi:hypothetical protein
VLSALLLLNLAHAAPPSPDTSKENDAPNYDVLLKAINFALTGGDRITHKFTDRLECVVTSAIPSAEQGVQAIDIFHLNNVDASRITLQKMQRTSQFETTPFVRVELHGDP